MTWKNGSYPHPDCGYYVEKHRDLADGVFPCPCPCGHDCDEPEKCWVQAGVTA